MARHHAWEDDGETFSIEETEGGRPPGVAAIVLEGSRFPHTFADSGEAPLAREILRLAARGLRAFDQVAADRLADEVAALVTRGILDSRSAAADALLDYREPPRTLRSDRIAALEELLARAASLQDEPEDGLTDVEADAQTLEGVYGPEE